MIRRTASSRFCCTSGPNPGGTGASVTKGQPLGLAGNSGRSSEPHLHIHVLRATKPWQGPPRPLPFNDINVLDLTLVDPNTWPPTADVPWNPVTAQDLPNVLSAIWPGQLSTNWWIWLGPLTWAWIIIIGGLIFVVIVIGALRRTTAQAEARFA